MIMSRATPNPSMRRGTFEEGEMIRGVRSVECGVRIPLRFCNHDFTISRCYVIT